MASLPARLGHLRPDGTDRGPRLPAARPAGAQRPARRARGHLVLAAASLAARRRGHDQSGRAAAAPLPPRALRPDRERRGTGVPPNRTRRHDRGRHGADRCRADRAATRSQHLRAPLPAGRGAAGWPARTSRQGLTHLPPGTRHAVHDHGGRRGPARRSLPSGHQPGGGGHPFRLATRHAAVPARVLLRAAAGHRGGPHRGRPAAARRYRLAIQAAHPPGVRYRERRSWLQGGSVRLARRRLGILRLAAGAPAGQVTPVARLHLAARHPPVHDPRLRRGHRTLPQHRVRGERAYSDQRRSGQRGRRAGPGAGTGGPEQRLHREGCPGTAQHRTAVIDRPATLHLRLRGSGHIPPERSHARQRCRTLLRLRIHPCRPHRRGDARVPRDRRAERGDRPRDAGAGRADIHRRLPGDRYPDGRSQGHRPGRAVAACLDRRGTLVALRSRAVFAYRNLWFLVTDSAHQNQDTCASKERDTQALELRLLQTARAYAQTRQP